VRGATGGSSAREILLREEPKLLEQFSNDLAFSKLQQLLVAILYSNDLFLVLVQVLINF
jgi:hypothetical protein